MAYCEHYYGANEWMNCKIDVWMYCSILRKKVEVNESKLIRMKGRICK
jgi:hypothetical protein